MQTFPLRKYSHKDIWIQTPETIQNIHQNTAETTLILRMPSRLMPDHQIQNAVSPVAVWVLISVTAAYYKV